MEELTNLISNSSWSEALILSNSLGLSPSYVSQLHFLSLTSNLITSTLAKQLLNQIDDKLWVASASLQLAKTSQDFNTVKVVIETGLEAIENYIENQEILKELVTSGNDSKIALERLCIEDEQVKKLCILKLSLLELNDKVKTWEEIWGNQISIASSIPKDEFNVRNEGDEEGTGWDDFELPSSPTLNSSTLEDSPSNPSISTFLNSPILDTVFALAALAKLESLLTICLRHSKETWSSRFEILATIPEWEEPSKYFLLLPGVDEKGQERKWKNESWRKESDWVEKLDLIPIDERGDLKLKSSTELTTYYQTKINHFSSLGLISIALSLVQHCGSLGIIGLEELGEELSLLSKLVYDRPSISSTSQSISEDLTLDYWHSLSPSQIVQSYLAYSTTSTIASDIRRLVLPYLSVLESRLERAGTPNSSYSTQLLIEYILNLVLSKRIDLLVPIFHASNPTLPTNQRLIESDSDLARLALACLYGSKETSSDSLISFGKIFECLPAFEEDDSTTSSTATTSQNLYDRSITSYTPQDLFTSLQSFSTSSLSHSLDALDLHLATSEIFNRYSVPVILSWFLSSHHDLKAQLNWATRMARTSSTGGIEEGTSFESEDEWEGLLEDMVAMTEEIHEEEEEVEGMRKPFWLVGTEEVTKIFFAGLLASGNFSLAKRLLHPSNAPPPLSPQVEEDLIILASHEFYDNAESGNLHKGEMKLAFDCLATAPLTPTIKKQRDFIEATSRLCSFKIYSQPGIPITPIQIRFAKDKLDFVARLLASNEDAYRHPDVVMELVKKLGYEGDKGAEIKVLAMIADSGLQAGDYTRAADVCDKMVAVVEGLRKDNKLKGIDNERMIEEGGEVAWRNCFQLGKHEEFNDLDRRMKLLGQALILCPGNKISTLLPVWNNLETLLLKKGLPQGEEEELFSRQPISSSSTLPSIPVPPPATKLTTAPSRTFTRAAAFLPFTIGPQRTNPTRVLSPQPQPQSQSSPSPLPPAPIIPPKPQTITRTPPPPPPPIQLRTRVSSPSSQIRSQSPKVPTLSQSILNSSRAPILSRSLSSTSSNNSNSNASSSVGVLPNLITTTNNNNRSHSPINSKSPSVASLFSSIGNNSSSGSGNGNGGSNTQFGNRRNNLNRSGSGSSVTSTGSGGGNNNNNNNNGGFFSNSSSSQQQQQQQSLTQSQRSYSSHPPSNYQQSLNSSTNSSMNSNSRITSPEITREMWDSSDNNEGLFGDLSGGISSRLTKGVGWLIGAPEDL